jgi:hypothetical protein
MHDALLHRLRGRLVNPELAPRGEKVRFLDFVRPYAGRDADHPQELVQVVTRVLNECATQDEDVGDVVFEHDWVGLLFGGRKGFANSGDMSCRGKTVVSIARGGLLD